MAWLILGSFLVDGFKLLQVSPRFSKYQKKYWIKKTGLDALKTASKKANP